MNVFLSVLQDMFRLIEYVNYATLNVILVLISRVIARVAIKLMEHSYIYQITNVHNSVQIIHILIVILILVKIV